MLLLFLSDFNYDCVCRLLVGVPEVKSRGSPSAGWGDSECNRFLIPVYTIINASAVLAATLAAALSASWISFMEFVMWWSVTIEETDPDLELLTQQTLCFSLNILARDNKVRCQNWRYPVGAKLWLWKYAFRSTWSTGWVNWLLAFRAKQQCYFPREEDPHQSSSGATHWKGWLPPPWPVAAGCGHETTHGPQQTHSPNAQEN